VTSGHAVPVVVHSLPPVDVRSLPPLDVHSLPSLAIHSLPSVAVSSIPQDPIARLGLIIAIVALVVAAVSLIVTWLQLREAVRGPVLKMRFGPTNPLFPVDPSTAEDLVDVVWYVNVSNVGSRRAKALQVEVLMPTVDAFASMNGVQAAPKLLKKVPHVAVTRDAAISANDLYPDGHETNLRLEFRMLKKC